MRAKIFIDGEAGTTGLQIRSQLKARDDIEIMSIPHESRKDPIARAEKLNNADLAILCLPDDAAKEAVKMIKNPELKLIDASSAHRTDPNWTYGFPELNLKQSKKITTSNRVSNPGCYALASIAIIHPLISANILPNDYPITINAISGYSGGGNSMIQSFEDKNSPEFTDDVFRVYALSLEHKHIPEIQKHSNLKHRPLFMPSVGRFAQGMIVQLPLQLWSLPRLPKSNDLLDALADHYKNQPLINVVGSRETAEIKSIQPEALKGSNELKLYVFNNKSEQISKNENQVVVMALLDNLGKGASGQAIQNMDLMLNLT
jgi:N-acetyl-gamma-glutamyl-phosphate reductase